MPDAVNVVAQQVEMYGEPLGARFARILNIYALSQARLAAVIGLSPPMLSQLMSGQRAKISNPAVLGRIMRLEELAGSPAVQAGDAAALDALLAEVTASRPVLSTRQVELSPAGDDATLLAAAARALARVIDPSVLARAATQTEDPRLRHVLANAATLG